jgi:hypothetical protein
VAGRLCADGADRSGRGKARRPREEGGQLRIPWSSRRDGPTRIRSLRSPSRRR